jgi:hypothetical protein
VNIQELMAAQRAGGVCERCGHVLRGPRGLAWSVHHRRPRGMGGSHRAHTTCACNLVLVCGSGVTGCHGWIESHRKAAKVHGWLVSQYQDEPSKWPLARHGGTVVLNCDGSFLPHEEDLERASYDEAARVITPRQIDAMIERDEGDKDHAEQHETVPDPRRGEGG